MLLLSVLTFRFVLQTPQNRRKYFKKTQQKFPKEVVIMDEEIVD
jgi:hypothetical protein